MKKRQVRRQITKGKDTISFANARLDSIVQERSPIGTKRFCSAELHGESIDLSEQSVSTALEKQSVSDKLVIQRKASQFAALFSVAIRFSSLIIRGDLAQLPRCRLYMSCDRGF